ncbi:GNAT family N-acetyltransferase [Longirhabdus pacifica]|uniref:GNAT family N-acetyltransferase n=1 Tax=Longirhabdus pacifica TaxID=2305227 RepID=UPI0013E8B68C|nr:GNAT family N-acetyltransferase [Longirhabdus pacifica]
MIHLRRAKSDDSHIYTLIEEQLLPYTKESNPHVKWNMVICKKRLAKGITWVIDTEQSKFVGFIHVLPKYQDVNVDLLAVRPKYQGNGYGKQLLYKAHHYALENGYGHVYVYVDRRNKGAQKFYKREGYASIGYDKETDTYLYKRKMKNIM